MGYHVHPIRAAVGSLHGVQRFGGLVLLCLLSFWLFAYTPAAHAVTLPFSENFNYSNGDNTPAIWQVQDQDASVGSYHDIRKRSLRIVAGGLAPLEDYYTVYLDAASGDFTATVQIKQLTDTDADTKAGLIVQNNLGSGSSNEAHVQVAASRSGGYLMLFDDNGDGTADQSFTISATPGPPNIWLRVVRSGNTFTGLYSTDNSSWAAIGSVTSSQATAALDVGLFGTSGAAWWIFGDLSIARFDNFTIIGSAAAFVYYEDSDGDNYGNPSASIVSSSGTPPSGYVADNTDCDDTDANTYPGAAEICDGKDNNCDGTIDEGQTTTTFYRDADGDGYGTIIDTHQGCTPNAGYVASAGDCNDNNALINPGAADICDNNIDEDCSGGDAACVSDTICDPISDTPLSVTVGGSPAIIMFLLDDSGSMEWSVMCAEDEGRFNGIAEYTENYARPRWNSQYHGYNRIYYDPNTVYEPWAKSASNTFSDATFTSVRKHPLNFYSNALKNENRGSNTITLERSFDSYSGYTVTFGHYYVVSTSDSQPYLVDLGIDSTGPTYYKVTQGSGTVDDKYRIVKSLTKLTTGIPADVAISGTFAEARTNFANWFTYHRTREISTKASLGLALQDLSGVKAGVYTFNRSVVKAASLISSTSDVETLLDSVYQVARSGYTPMRLALEDVGQYFHADDGKDGGIGPNPFATSADGGDCQQAFVILMTDGYGNGGAPSVGNADADNNTAWDGPEFYGKNSNRLPDVAMYYYENDIASGLADEVPLQDAVYEAPHQRMVTYSVSFGIQGHFSQAAYTNCPPPPTDPTTPIDCPTWLSGGTNEAKVDELWHAAANGRGQYINTGTPQELADAINTVLNDITRRIGTAASVAVSSEKLETGLVIYQGFFDSGDWSGNLEAFDVTPNGTVNLTPKWSAKTQLNAANWNTGRHILTINDATPAAVAFRHGNLSAAQKAYITQDQLNYIRGDDTNEEDNGGTLRDRNTKLGDITHSSPILHDGVVYVGANDGMFHAFDADTGDELFAYVPSFVYSNLEELTSTSYIHKFYADGTGTAKTVSTGSGDQDWVVSGLRKGGRGLFGINVTNPKSIKETAIPTIWEYPTQASPDLDMGYTYGEVTIAEGNDSSAGGQLVFAANGYDSPNGHAVLFILKLDGTLFKKIDTGVGSSTPGSCNGLSDPLVVDLDDDGKADVVYAGDIRGNLWKFDISKPSKASWDVAYKTGTDSKPLFTVQNSSGQIQPITSKPAAMFHCDPTKKGTILVFGTGRMLSDADLANTNVQTVYGIWDWQAEWTDQNISDTTPYHMGTFNTPSGSPAVRTLSNIDGNATYFPQNVDLTLLQQAQTSATDDWRYTSNTPIDWFSPEEYLALGAGGSYTGGTHIGWYLNLPDIKERVITKTQIRDGKAYIVSIIPIPAPCSSGGTTVGSILSACNGGQLQDPQWDTNGDGVVDSNDNSASGKKFDDDIYYAPAIIEDKLFFTKDRVEETTDETRGLFYWRIRE